MSFRPDPRVVAEARALEGLATSGLDPQLLLDRVIEALVHVGEADHVLFYRVESGPKGRRVTASAFHGDERVKQSVFHGFDAIDRIHSNDARVSSWNARNVRALDSSAFVEGARCFTRRDFETLAMFVEVFAPVGIDDQQRLMVRDGANLAGWLGLFRGRTAPHFTARDRRRLAPLVRVCTANIVAATRLLVQGIPDEPGDFVLAPDGRVEFASQSGAAWLARPGFDAALRAYVRSVDRGEAIWDPGLASAGAEPRVLRLEGDGGVRYVVNVCPLRPLRVSSAHPLTQAEREVAELAAAGASASDIARLRCTSEGTVRNQLKKVYAVLEVSNRIELARALDEAAKA